MRTRRACLALGLFLCLGSGVRAELSPPDTIRRQAVEWFKGITGRDAGDRMVTSVIGDIDKALEDGRHVMLMVPAAFSRDGRAYYGVSWAGLFHAFPMTNARGQRIGLSPTAVTTGSGAKRSDSRAPLPAGQLDRLRIDRVSGDRKITGSVACNLFDTLPEGLLLRISYKTRGYTTQVTKPLRSLPGDGVIRFEIDPINRGEDRPHAGPLPLFVDLCVEKSGGIGRHLSVVSNTLGTLLEVPASTQGRLKTFAKTVSGTKWQFNGTKTTIEFLAGGSFRWNGEASRGWWKQEGKSILVNVNDFTLFRLSVDGDAMSGTWERLQGQDKGKQYPSGLKRIAN